MCEGPYHEKCHQVKNIAELATKDDLLKYKEYLENELNIVKKALQDIEDDISM